MKRLQPLDIVRTSFGTLGVVDAVSGDGSVSLVLPANSSQKTAWYKPSELVFVASVKDVVAQVPTLTQAKPKREKIVYPKFFGEMYEDVFGNQNRNQFGMN